jgi:hypothetical protein
MEVREARGVDREAAKQAFAGLLARQVYRGTQVSTGNRAPEPLGVKRVNTLRGAPVGYCRR